MIKIEAVDNGRWKVIEISCYTYIFYQEEDTNIL